MLGPTIMVSPGQRKMARPLIGRLPASRRPEDQLRRDRDRLVQRSIHRTELREHRMYPLRSRLLVRGRPQTHPDVNSPDDEHVVLGQFDFTDRFAGQPVAVSPDVARLQRAPEGPRQSARRRGDDVVECRGAGLECGRGDLVVLGDRPVDAEDNRLRLAREVGAPDRPFHPFYSDVRPIHDVGQSRAPLLPWSFSTGTMRPTPPPRREEVALITKHSCSWLRLPQAGKYPAVTGTLRLSAPR